MRFAIMLDPQLQLFGYSEETLDAPNERYLFTSNGQGNVRFERKPLVLNRSDRDSRFTYLDAGYVDVAHFATKASTFEGHDRNLQRLDALFRRYWERDVLVVDEPAQYGKPVTAMVKWARARPSIGAPGQVLLALPLVPVLRTAAAPSKYDFYR